MDTRNAALTRRACRLPISRSYSKVASTNSAKRCHCTDLPGPKPLDSIVRPFHLPLERKKNARTKATELISVSELRAIFRRHRRTVATGNESLWWFGRRFMVIPSVVRSVSVSGPCVVISTSTKARVVLGLDHRKVNRQDHGKHDRHDGGGRNKPEDGSPGERFAMFGLSFDHIPLEILFGFRNQRSRPRRSQRISRRGLKRREVPQGSWGLEQIIVLARWCGE